MYRESRKSQIQAACKDYGYSTHLGACQIREYPHKKRDYSSAKYTGYHKSGNFIHLIWSSRDCQLFSWAAAKAAINGALNEDIAQQNSFLPTDSIHEHPGGNRKYQEHGEQRHRDQIR